MHFLALIGRISPFIFAVLAPVFLFLVWFNLGFLKPYDKSTTSLVAVEIPKDASIEDVARMLSDNGVVRSSFATKLLIKRIGKRMGKEISFLEGEYEVSPAEPPSRVVSHLMEGNTVKRSFTISAGETYRDIAQAIEDSALYPKEVILKAMTKRDLLLRLKLDAGIPEGYFLPGEFTFSKPVTPEEVVEKMIRESSAIFKAKFPDIGERIVKLDLDVYRLLTLASMLEKEGSTTEMRKNIASVYYNRIMLQMPFESYETMRYPMQDKTTQITNREIDVPGPYNTFLRWGFPASPICTPSIDSIDAALFPSQTEFLYFVPNPSSIKDFSLTFNEHQNKLKKKGKAR
jgi:UPF0755 protein